jgi:hypothetical protein
LVGGGWITLVHFDVDAVGIGDQRFPAAGGDFKDLNDPCEPIAARETSDPITELEPGPES